MIWLKIAVLTFNTTHYQSGKIGLYYNKLSQFYQRTICVLNVIRQQVNKTKTTTNKQKQRDCYRKNSMVVKQRTIKKYGLRKMDRQQ